MWGAEPPWETLLHVGRRSLVVQSVKDRVISKRLG